MVPLDLAEMKSTVIPLEGEMRQAIFSPAHRWRENGLLWLDYSGNTYQRDLSEGKVRFWSEETGLFRNAVSLIRKHRMIHFGDGMLVLEDPSGGKTAKPPHTS